MLSVGIDVSKEKSTVCVLRPYGEIVQAPYEFEHSEFDLSKLVEVLHSFDGEVRIVPEATGAYHLPVVTYLKRAGFFISVINPVMMKKYFTQSMPMKICACLVANIPTT